MKKKDKNLPLDPADVKEGVEKSVKGIRKLLQEFKDFAMRGNVIDMAVGIVIGSAFTAMVQSLVNDTFMPIITYFIGGVDYNDLVYNGIEYGKTITAIVNFIILAAVVFLVVKGMNALANIAKKEEKEDLLIATELEVLEEIRDLLKDKNSNIEIK